MDVSDIFNFFSARRRGKGSPRRREGGERFFCTKNPRRGVSRAGGAGGEGPGGCLRGFWGGGVAKFFFSGPKFPPSLRKIAGTPAGCARTPGGTNRGLLAGVPATSCC